MALIRVGIWPLGEGKVMNPRTTIVKLARQVLEGKDATKLARAVFKAYDLKTPGNGDAAETEPATPTPES